MNTDKNTYTIIYSVVMVVLAAVLLAAGATFLKPAQEQNAKVDKMQQILRSIGETPAKEQVNDTYRRFVKEELLVSSQGEVLQRFQGDELTNSDAFNANTEFMHKTRDYSKGLPVFIAEKDGRKIYILALNGSGLWNKIWGYMAIDAIDHSSIVGVDFGNAGETPGLGAEISTPLFASQFVSKQIFKDNVFKGVAVVKPGKTLVDQDYVDGISGGTLTSDGVHAMIANSLAPYQKFLETYQAQ